MMVTTDSLERWRGRATRSARRTRFPWYGTTLAAVALLLVGCGGESQDGDSDPPAAPVAEALRQLPRFEDFPVVGRERIDRPAPVQLSSHPEGREFRTVLTRGAAQGPNFAGHFTVVSWGCGTMCQRVMVLDARTGRILTDLTASLGVDHRLESRLLVVNPRGAVEESPCPGCATEYHLLDEARGLVRVPEIVWIGPHAPPHPHATLVASVRSAEHEAGLPHAAPQVFRDRWDRLTIVSADGTRHSFDDEIVDGGLRWLHRFAGSVEGLDASLVERMYIPHGNAFMLIDGARGDTVVLDAPPVASPDGARFVTASLDLVAGHSPNRIRIYRTTPDGPRLEWESSPTEWGARAPVWVDTGAVRLERAVVDWNDHELVTSPMRLELSSGEWEVQSSAEHARDALVAFFSALANGQHGEATRHFGGSYEILRGWNPEHPAEDLAGLWRLACDHNGLQCLGRLEVVEQESLSPEETRFRVRFRTADGELFVLGPCCGETAEEMPPQTEFPFTVRREGDSYLVRDLPVYMP